MNGVVHSSFTCPCCGEKVEGPVPAEELEVAHRIFCGRRERFEDDDV